MDANPQATATPADNGGNPGTPPDNGGQTANTQTTTKSVDNPNPEPFMTFQTQADFDKHSAGILNSAKNKAEKELLAMLGLKPDEKDKLAKFKEAYDATLTDAEKKAKELDRLTSETGTLKAKNAELEATLSALTKVTGTKTEDILKFVLMAKGLVNETTTMEQALEQVFSMTAAKAEPQKPATPQGTPPADNQGNPSAGENPFKTGNLTEQGKLFKTDPEKARKLYKEAKGKEAPF